MRRRGKTFVFGLAAAAALATSAPALAGSCGSAPYAYAGAQSTAPVFGVGARITPLATPGVLDGHVGAWVGVGAPGAGPNGEDEWIQVGFSAFPTGPSGLYYEVARPGRAPSYHAIQARKPGASHRVSVLEMIGRRSHWRVWVDGRPMTPPVYLPGSHGAWQAVATTESWSPTRACNRFRYRFSKVRIAASPGGRWVPTRFESFFDRGYGIRGLASDAFVAGEAQPTRVLASG